MSTPETAHDPILWKQAKNRVGFRTHLRSYLTINAGLWLLYLVTSLSAGPIGFRHGYVPWPLFAMLGWGIGLVSHYLAVYRYPNERNQIEKEYEKLKRQQAW
ncbi:2TM domain-containing protein [uncultured Fibrella sp.]|uniref:2TM domain-containing protein n=1 Tax=uncultured Fibrella sp. TaxID=1284596 RepID=UPI0035C977C4